MVSKEVCEPCSWLLEQVEVSSANHQTGGQYSKRCCLCPMAIADLGGCVSSQVWLLEAGSQSQLSACGCCDSSGPARYAVSGLSFAKGKAWMMPAVVKSAVVCTRPLCGQVCRKPPHMALAMNMAASSTMLSGSCSSKGISLYVTSAAAGS